MTEWLPKAELYSRRWFEEPGFRIYLRTGYAKVFGHDITSLNIQNFECHWFQDVYKKGEIDRAVEVIDALHKLHPFQCTYLETPPEECWGGLFKVRFMLDMAQMHIRGFGSNMFKFSEQEALHWEHHWQSVRRRNY